jgi:hypothetical protein
MATAIGVEEAAALPQTRPYPPSWVDRLTDGVRRLPGPAWAYYLGVALLFFTGYMALHWVAGTYPPGTFSHLDVLTTCSALYVLGVLHYLDDHAGAALDRFRPALGTSDAEYAVLRYRITTMSARWVWVATAAGVGLVLLTVVPALLAGELPPGWGALPLLIPVELFFIFISWTGYPLLIYHTIHQLRVVASVYRAATRINLFRPGPIYALSGLTARTAIGTSLVGIAWNFSPDSAGTISFSEDEVFQIVSTGLGVLLTFAWPLLGIHRLLEQEKKRLQDANGRQMEAAIGALEQRVAAREFDSGSGLKDTIDGLVAVRGELNKLPTWPWQTGTIAAMAATVLLPLFLWLIQRILDRVLTF